MSNRGRHRPDRDRLAIATATALLAGCGAPHRAPEADILARHDELRRRAHREFDQARYYKPQPESAPALDVQLAPLILVELPGDASPAPAAAGMIIDPPVVRVDRTTAHLVGRHYEQHTYVWQCASRSGKEAPAPAVHRQGIRITFGAAGLPVIWEALDERSPEAVVFVAASLERAASAAFGPPFDGRRWSVERALDERPEVVVARVLDDGPQPMGPWVYLGSAGEFVTVLCRCSPSQYRAAAETIEYEFVPGLGAVGGWIAMPAERTAPDWLERALRLPPGF